VTTINRVGSRSAPQYQKSEMDDEWRVFLGSLSERDAEAGPNDTGVNKKKKKERHAWREKEETSW